VLTDDLRRRAAEALASAEEARTALDAPLSETFDGLELDDAYAIQLRNIRARLAAGATIRGYKVGLTSVAMQTALGVDRPDYGHLLDDMFHDDGAVLPRSAWLAPKAEPEVAFVLGERLRGPGVTAADVVRATAFLLPSIEIIDSRIAGWRITLVDTVADNASSAGVVLGGRPTPLADVDPRRIGVVMRRNGEIVETGATGAVLGSPVSAVAWLANTLAPHDVSLEPGHVILPGSPVKAVDVSAGDVLRADFDRLGAVSFGTA
jgi:2-keto-4-pentenoate hydratase